MLPVVNDYAILRHKLKIVIEVPLFQILHSIYAIDLNF